MKSQNFFDCVMVDEYSATPKYLQLCNSIISAVEDGKLKKNESLPSINELSYMLDISRDTAEKGYKILKSKGVILSYPGKGYYVGETQSKKKLKIFLLFNKLSAHKKIIYDAFVTSIGDDVKLDFFIYNNDFSIFKKLILNRKSDYTHYVIIPHFTEGGEQAYEVINTLPKDQLLLLDKKLRGIEGDYAAIYENFERDIYEALLSAKESLSKYHTLKIVFPEKSYFPQEIVNGFRRFCQQFAFNHAIISNLETEPINSGEVFINLMEDDLVTLVQKIISNGLTVGKDVGVISYNETPIKKIILNGITTISTDFEFMGSLAADFIKNKKIEQKEVPFKLTLRASL